MKKLIFIGVFTIFTSIYSSLIMAAKCDHCSTPTCGCHSNGSKCVANDSSKSCSVPPHDSCEKCSTFCGGYNYDCNIS
jgi:hypothetical protein